MARWITFDQHTAYGLRSRLPQEPVFEAPGRNAVEYALNAAGSVVAIFPLRVANGCAVAVFRPPRRQQTVPAAKRVVRATGFLGLGDEAVFEEQEPAQSKSWWRKLWED